MAVYLKSNEQGGGIVTQASSEDGIQIKNDAVNIIYQIQSENNQYLTSGSFSDNGVHFLNSHTDGQSVNCDQQFVLSAKNEMAGTGVTDYIASLSNIMMRIDEHGEPIISGGALNIRSYAGSSNNDEKDPIGISFIDTTIDPQNPQKVYRLKDFALKSDIPAGVDLTNYEGDWNLTKQVSAGNVTVSLQSLSYFQPDISAGTLFNTEPLKTLISVASGSFADYLINDGDSLKVFSGTGYSSAIQAVEYQEQNGGTDVAYSIVNQGQYQLVADHYAGSDIDIPTYSTACEIDQHGVFLESMGRGEDDIECSFYICSSLPGTGYHRGIWFRDTSIQSSDFSLKSLVDRIAALESKVTELETALANKANTNSPTFTGKVTINPITE